eukprot:GGOE01004770.1.p1 GENE.GGOE01004770.1~~GGOE01004770.1.p1  ORF type:complete len:466 (+),score=112.93 GGOE01004770.1:127-1524(+)
MEWRYEHCYGKGLNEEVVEGDHITAVEYDATGNLLAFGDRAGRVTVLQRWTNPVNQTREMSPSKRSTAPARYLLCTTFQSHEPQFDCLKSVEIEEHINRICWLPPHTPRPMLLATNDKTIKLWRLRLDGSPLLSPRSGSGSGSGSFGGTSPRTNGVSPLLAPRRCPSASPATLKREFANNHMYHINSIWLNSDSQSFLSADDLRINLWHLDHTESLNVVDLKPENMEDLCEVITSAAFHPDHCAVFAFSTSKGSIRLGDLRHSTTVRSFLRSFEVEDDPAHRTFFTEIVSSISDMKISNNGRFILARDYLTLKVWDTNMEREPVKVITLHEPLRKRLCDLYENDCIFDKFECSWSSDGRVVATGSYRNHFKVKDVTSLGQPSAKSTKSPLKSAAQTFECAPLGKKPSLVYLRKLGKGSRVDEAYDKGTMADFSRKALHLAFHPQEYEVAVATQQTLGLFLADHVK